MITMARNPAGRVADSCRELGEWVLSLRRPDGCVNTRLFRPKARPVRDTEPEGALR